MQSLAEEVAARKAQRRTDWLSSAWTRSHNALKTPHARRLARNKLEPAASYGMRRVAWFGSRINETSNAIWEARKAP